MTAEKNAREALVTDEDVRLAENAYWVSASGMSNTARVRAVLEDFARRKLAALSAQAVGDCDAERDYILSLAPIAREQAKQAGPRIKGQQGGHMTDLELYAVDFIRKRYPTWQPIATMPTDDTIILALAANGMPMVYRASILARNLAGPTPAHLKFPAVAWMHIPALAHKDSP